MLLLSIRRQSGTMVDEISAFGGDCLHRGSMLQLSIARPFCMTPPYWSSLSSNNTNTYCSIVLNIQTFGVILNHDDGIATRHRNNMHCKILQYLSSRNMILQYENILQYHIAIFWYFAILIAILGILQYIVQYCASKNHHQAMVNLWAQPLRPLCFTKS